MFRIDTNGDITLIQGDTGTIEITQLPTSPDWTNEYLYFAFSDGNLRVINGTEINLSLENCPKTSDGKFYDTIKFFVTSVSTELLTVPKLAEEAEYHYGIKHCYTDEYSNRHEDTLLLNEDADPSVVNTVYVYPIRVSGYANIIEEPEEIYEE